MKIAISGKSGCGNSTVTQLVADMLGYHRVNYTFKDMARDHGISFAELCDLAENDSQWDIKLDRKQVEMARSGDTVLGSRLAIWILDDADLRVYLEAEPEVRAGRIRKRNIENHETPTDMEAVLQQTVERDRRDHDRYKRLYGIDNDNYGFADLVVDANSDDPETIAQRIVEEVERLKAEQ